MRVFKTGGLRDNNKGKLEYIGFTHPLCEQSFAQYMHRHRFMKDGSLRASNNWWKGWDKHISLDSMIRHVMDLRALEAGYNVYKEQRDDEEITHYIKGKGNKDWHQVDEEECCNAIRFNADAYKLQII